MFTRFADAWDEEDEDEQEEEEWAGLMIHKTSYNYKCSPKFLIDFIQMTPKYTNTK